MADVRFKISGDTPSFVAKLYDNSARSVVLQQKFVDYSGTCVTFGNLPSTSMYYYVKVCDAIGNIATGITCTSGTVIGTTTLATKSISMGGTAIYDPDYPSYCYLGHENGNTNKINVNPPLISGESVDLTFTVCMENQSEAPVPTTMYNEVSIYCKPAGINTYSRFYHCCTSAYNTTNTVIKNLKYNDSICYEIMSADNTGSPGTEVGGYSWLCLSDANNSVGFIPTRVAPTCKRTQIDTSISTTTTVPPPQPISVYFGDITNLMPSSPWYVCKLSAKLKTTPTLTAGQSFRLCYVDTAISAIGVEGVIKQVKACTCIKDNTNISYGVATSIASAPSAYDCCCKSGYLTIDCNNINNYTFYTTACSHDLNLPYGHSASSTSKINKLCCQNGGVYQIGSCDTVLACVQP